MATQFDLVIRNGLLVDGTGAEPSEADVAIAGGKIAASSGRPSACTVADAP
jgi:N-acyl-D-aspartate/D-glutamate deacylase